MTRTRSRTPLIAVSLLVLSNALTQSSWASLQTRVIFPGHTTQGQPSSQVVVPESSELVHLKTRGAEQIVALFARALGGDGRPVARPADVPTILYFYGNAMCLAKSLDEVAWLRSLGANVLIPEYVGYGLSSGRPSERGCYDTADAAFDYLQTRADINRQLIVASGWSLGSAVAVDLASRKPVAGVALFSAMTSMVEMSHQHFPWLPASILLRHRFDSESKMSKIRAPILLGHGREDGLIPYAMSDRLALAAGGSVTRVSIEHAGHNDLFSVGRAQLGDALRQWLGTIQPNANEGEREQQSSLGRLRISPASRGR